MKKFLFIFISISYLFSFDFKKEYFKGNYEEICKYGVSHISKFKHLNDNEDTLSLIGFSCVKSDYIVYLAPIINYLRYTKKGRENGIYFSLLFIEKKLLISYMLDGLDISYYRFPLIKHPISIVINSLINKNFKRDNNKIIIKKDNKKYIVYSNDEHKVFIDIYENGMLIKSHWYR